MLRHTLKFLIRIHCALRVPEYGIHSKIFIMIIISILIICVGNRMECGEKSSSRSLWVSVCLDSDTQDISKAKGLDKLFVFLKRRTNKIFASLVLDLTNENEENKKKSKGYPMILNPTYKFILIKRPSTSGFKF